MNSGIIVILGGGIFASFAFAEALVWCFGAKANVRLAKIELKKMYGEENKKKRRAALRVGSDTLHLKYSLVTCQN